MANGPKQTVSGRPFTDRQVAAVFDAYPDRVRSKLLYLRQLIYETATMISDIGELTETLKWGEPAYLTDSRVGSTIRIDWKHKFPDQYAMYFNCKTTLVDSFKEIYGTSFRYEGNRAIIFLLEDELPIYELKQCIASALTYHRRTRR